MKLEIPVENLLRDLKLHGMLEGLTRRLKEAEAEGLGCEDVIACLLHDEVEYRRNARVKLLLRTAAFRQSASLEGLDYAPARGLDKKRIADLAGCRFIRDGLSVLILGPTGAGKTYLASAIGNAACRRGHTTLFFRLNNLIEQMALARVKGTYLNLVRRLSVADVLILDDFGIKPLQAQQYQDLYDVIDERGEGKSTIITSQLPPANWSEVIADAVSCEAITDRLASRAVTIEMKGESQRRRRRPAGEVPLDTN